MSDSLRSLLERGAARLGVELPDEAALLVLKFLILLEKWNTRINLTGTRSDREIVERHLLDSMALLPHVPSDARGLVDVGSGAGLPGAVLAMFRPALSVTALEPIRKKHAFLAALRRELSLSNFDPLPQRVEAYRDSAAFAPFDVAVSRATWPVGEWLQIGATLVRPGGVVLGMEGADATDLPPDVTRHPYELGDRTRAIIRWAR